MYKTDIKKKMTALALSLFSSSVLAAYPEQPITLVVPFPAGSGTDAVGRIFASEMSSRLGQPVIVENKPGANATIAAQHVAKSKPDGYTILISTNTPLSAAPWLMKNVSYDVVNDFTPVARGGNLPFILITHASKPYQTVKDLVEYAKANPGKLSYASGNSTGIVAGATLGNTADIDILHVPYKGTPQAITDLIGGQVDFMFTDLASGIPFVKSNKVKALAVSTAKPSALLPELPSMEAAGINNFDINSWNGFLGPAGLSDEVVQTLNKTINEIVEDKEIKQKLANLGFDAFSGAQQEFADFVKQQYVLWGDLIKAAGIEQK